MISVGINGLGRIGKTFLRTVYQHPTARKHIRIKAINLGPVEPEAALYALKYDTIMGRIPVSVSLEGATLVIDGDRIPLVSYEDDLGSIWSDHACTYVVEASGRFTNAEKAQLHVRAGAQKVIITAPAQGDDVSIVMGVNETEYKPSEHSIISLGSCTTNACVPLLAILDECAGIEQGWMTTVHAYTNTQRLVDAVSSAKDPRRERAGALNIIPSSTGASGMIEKILPGLRDKIDAMAVRVPVGTGSFIDLSVIIKKRCVQQEIERAFREAAAGRMSGVVKCSDDPLVSSDCIGDSHSSIVDMPLIQVHGSRVKVCSWYDNEWGYSCRILDFFTICCTDCISLD